MIIVDTTLPTVLFVLVALYYLALLAVAHLPRRELSHGLAVDDLLFVVLVPCRNEATVIADTIRHLPRRGRGLVALVIDDGSTDETGIIAGRFRRGVRVLSRDPAVAGQGKGEALNAGFAVVRDGLRGHGPMADDLAGVDPWRVVVTVLDADGRFDENALVAAADRLGDPEVGAVQIAVTIENRSQGLLPTLQDVEFIGFSQLVQRARDRFGSLGLGGNGQFVRLDVLEELGDAPWSRCLTEDLDLGLRIVLNGWQLRFAHEAAVRQQGVVSIRALVRQRTRWAQGHLTCWRHLPRIVDDRRRLPVATALDLTLYLSLIAVAAIVGLNAVVSIVAQLVPQVVVANEVAALLGRHGTLWLTLLGMVPAALFVLVQQARVPHGRAWTLPLRTVGLVVVFVLYTYVWVAAITAACVRLARGRDDWAKTARVATVPVETAA